MVGTHHHPDHIGLAGWFQSQHGAELVTTRTAWLFARMLTLDVQEVWPEETLAYYRSAGMAQEIYEKRVNDRPFNFADTVHPMPLGFTRIKQGDVIRMGGRDWDVHTGNGHAPEHATFWSRDDNLVITGDQILSTISPNIGVYATEPMADPLGEWLESLRAAVEAGAPRSPGLGRPQAAVHPPAAQDAAADRQSPRRAGPADGPPVRAAHRRRLLCPPVQAHNRRRRVRACTGRGSGPCKSSVPHRPGGRAGSANDGAWLYQRKG